MPASCDRERAAERARVPRSGCRCSTTWSWRWRTPAPTRARSSRACGRSATRRVAGARTRSGYPRHDEIGVPFDPARHEAVGVPWTNPSAAPGTVVEVLRPGYGDGERPAAARRGGRQPAERVSDRWPATTTRSSGSPRTPRPDEIQRAYRKLARTVPPGRQQGPGAEDGSRRSTRRTRCCPTRRPGGATTGSAPTSGRCPRTTTNGSGHGAGGSGGGFGGGGYGGGARRRTAALRSGVGGEGGVDFEDLFGGCSAGGRRVGPVPGADQEAELRADRRGGVPRRPPHDHPAPDGRAATTSTSRPVSSTASGSGSPVRAAGARRRAAGRPLPGRADRAASAVPRRGPGHHVDCRSPRGRRRSAPTSPVDDPGRRGEGHVPPGSSSGRRLRLRGQGMPNPRGAPGDLYAEVRVMVPPRLTARERRAVRGAGRRCPTFDPRRR